MLIVFAILQAFAGVINPDKNDPAIIGSLRWWLFHAAMFTGYALATIGVFAIYLHVVETARRAALSALLLTQMANVLLTALAFYQAYAVPMVQRHVTADITVNRLRDEMGGALGSGYMILLMLAGLCFFVGYLMTAFLLNRTQRFPAAIGWLLVIGNLLGFVEFIVPSLTEVATLVSGIVFDAGIGWLGVLLLRRA